MNITILITTLRRGGAERIASALANDFCHRGDSVTIITFDNISSSYSLHEKVQVLSAYAGNKPGILNMAKRILLLKKILKKNNPDVVLCFFIKTVYYALLAAPRKVKIIGSERSNPFYEKKNSFSRFLELKVLPRADGFIFLTPEAQKYYTKKIQENSIVIPNGLFAEDIPRRVSTFADRNETEISAVGRMHPVKDYMTMIEAFNLFSKAHPEYILKIYGEGNEYERINKRIIDLGLEKKIILRGVVENVVEQISNTAMYVLTSKSESWSNSLMEALACGIPCISTDCDFGPRSMIINGVNGLLVPVGDVKAVADAMSKLANDRVLAQHISKNALSIRETHSASMIAEKYYNYICR